MKLVLRMAFGPPGLAIAVEKSWSGCNKTHNQDAARLEKKVLHLHYCMHALLSTPGEALFALQPSSTLRENLDTHYSSSADLFFQKQALKISTTEKTKHFTSQGDGEHAGAHYKAHMPCSRNVTFLSLNDFSSDTLQSSRICTPFLGTHINRNTHCSSGSGILLVAAAWQTFQI